MSAEQRVATVTPLSSRMTPDPEQTLPAVPEKTRPPATQVVKQVAHQFDPPDIWSDDRPGLRKLWLYGAYGRWTRQDGFARFAGKAYAVLVAWPVTALLYSVAWIFERPARLAVALLVAGLTRLAF